MSIPQETIKAIKDRVNLADLIGESVQLKRSGRSFLGLCPFHAEKSPSFNVNAEEGFYHCFGCSKHGTAFDFVMETRGLTFIEAVKFLAARVGIEVRTESAEKSEVRKKEEEQRKILRGILREVVLIAQENLSNDSLARVARDYLQERGVKSESSLLFRLGYFPDRRGCELPRLVSERAKLPLEHVEKALFQLGVIGRTDGGQLYETFRGRLIFPILRSDGAPVALGGRILEAAPNRPKYINSKESPIYSKRQTLYGLSHAMPYVRRDRQVLLVEGYMDVIALAQAGFPSAIATCGTSITPEHVELLRRFCEKVIVVMDSDTAGRKAAANCFELFLNSGIEVFSVTLPPGEDPGSFLIGKRLAEIGVGLDRPAEQIVQAEFDNILREDKEPILKTYLNFMLSQTEGGPAAVGKVSEGFVRILSKLKNPVEREANLALGAGVLGVSREALSLLNRSTKRPVERRPGQSRSDSRGPNSSPGDNVTTAASSAKAAKAKSDAASDKRVATALHARMTFYIEQMLLSVISEPALSRSLLEMEQSLKELATEDFPVTRLKSLLQTISEEDFVGLANFRGRERTEEFKSYLVRFSSVLAQQGLDGRALLTKAWNQVVIGGARPDKVIQEAPELSRELSLRAEVEKIRLKERQTSEEGELGDLLQRKLLERRKLRSAQNLN